MTRPSRAIPTLTARSPNASGQRLPLPRGWRCPLLCALRWSPETFPHERGRSSTGRSAFPAQPGVGENCADSAVGCVLARTPGAQSRQRLPVPGPAWREATAPPQSAGTSDPAAPHRSRPHRPVAQSDRAAPAPPGGWRFAPSGAGAALCRGGRDGPGAVFPLERGRSSTGRSAFSAQPSLRANDPTAPVGRGHGPCRPAPVPPAQPSVVHAATVAGRHFHMSGAALPPEDRRFPLSPASEKKRCGLSGRVRACTHRLRGQSERAAMAPGKRSDRTAPGRRPRPQASM